MNKIFKGIMMFACFSTLFSCSSKKTEEFDYDTCELKEFANIDFSYAQYKEKKTYVKQDVSKVEFTGKRECSSDEVEVKVYYYDDDKVYKGVYQYLKLGGDYRGEPYSENSVDFYSALDPTKWYGIGVGQDLIGYYTDSSFKELIDINDLKSIPSSLKEIHVRTAERFMTYRFIFDGTYYGDYQGNKIRMDVSNQVLKLTLNNDEYRIGHDCLADGYTSFHKNGEFLGTSSNFWETIVFGFGAVNLYKKIYVKLDFSPLMDIKFDKIIFYSEQPYSCFSYLK